MGIKETIIEVASPTNHKVHGGTQNPPPDQWVPFEWDEPKYGRQIQGEICVIRTEGVGGKLQAGFWRNSAASPGSERDGSNKLIYSSPLGDETAVVLEGSAVITVASTGKKYVVAPGSVVSHPKNLEVTWDIQGPFFKKYWCIWNGSAPSANPPTDLLISNINDNGDDWQDYHFNEPKEGALVKGELFFIRSAGSTGTMMSGIWRSGTGIAGSDADAKGTLVTPYTGVLGDETILLLEGEVDVIETQSGRKHSFRAGDVIGLSSGMHVTWISKGPFSKKLWVITKDQLAQ
ncbi:cupin domain-containing protein [Nevskia ramosa]|uniref:cupin domain-containing protein n=1 Tax=Nevskia ramosa TaxID=64002 RepID=UPI003D10A8E8